MKRGALIFVLLVFMLAACGPQKPATLTVMTHDSFAVSEEVIAQFEQQNKVDVVFVQGGDTGSMLNTVILSKDAPLADVLYGVDNTSLSHALSADIYAAYASPELAEIPEAFKLDPENRALPVDYGDVCVNFDKAYFSANALPVPQSLADLTKPEYKGLLVVEDPVTSSPGLAFLLATVAQFGDGYQGYWQQLKDNGVVVVDSWETAYYTNFSASSGKGPQPMVVSYGSSPAAEVIFADPPVTEAPTDSIVSPGSCFRQIEFVGILKDSQNRALAEKFIDFMLGKTFQENMPMQMFVFPVRAGAQLPQVFQENVQIPDQPALLSPEEIATNRQQWLSGWNEVMK